MKKSLKHDLHSFELQIRRCDIVGSYDIADHTLKLVLKAIESPRISSFEVERSIKFIVETLMDHFPSDVIIVNVCKIILNRLNDELRLSQPKKRSHKVKKSLSILDMMTLGNEDDNESEPKSELKTRMTEFLELQIENLVSSYEMIAKNAPNFLFKDDIILTVGNSGSIFKFLTSCPTDITVVIPEGAPSYDGVKFADKLIREKSIRVIVIPDSAIFAIFPRINKVIVPARAVLSNGGIVSFSLTHSIALAAKHHAKPFIALYWVMKLAEKVPRPGTTFTTLLEPEKIFEKENPLSSNVVALNAESDYVPPELITLMINEDGAHCPADVFSLVQENYADAN
ncbi:Translation initiation factor eIF-2B subunit beta [Histomonas meleagridis]|uniref:Translation initiation factor eIF-2B subunit beta n=1 Tax=Histomonas meleagridis TaxID=135588 RepID=UPI00355ACC79|nr:Translation initiation factor eIF-2B subunit beta [Histomonas meleagridis]KAH0802074.1 Translation initiation factor eIF-2B subunit beta [Histomonas meleagridis]